METVLSFVFMEAAPSGGRTRRRRRQEVMIANKSVGAALAIGIACISATGCASQSAAFRQMSATDHDVAARATGDSTLAAEHVEAATRLRNDEAVACDGVTETDRDQGAFARASDITGVEVLRDRGAFPKGPLQPSGIAVYLRAEPGMTQQWLGRIVACRRAHVAVVGQDRSGSPLTVPDSEVAVSSTQVGFRVSITSHDVDAVRSVVERAKELASTARRTIAWN
jgi:hypothetical protein